VFSVYMCSLFIFYRISTLIFYRISTLIFYLTISLCCNFYRPKKCFYHFPFMVIDIFTFYQFLKIIGLKVFILYCPKKFLGTMKMKNKSFSSFTNKNHCKMKTSSVFHFLTIFVDVLQTFL
jgi:hypothetical protein